MNKLLSSFAPLLFATVVLAQDYPATEFSNEICLFKKDNSKLMRLEKGSFRMETKAKVMGLGGMENGYTLDNEKSQVRINDGDNPQSYPC
jgi:hypothetical protein